MEFEAWKKILHSPKSSCFDTSMVLSISFLLELCLFVGFVVCVVPLGGKEINPFCGKNKNDPTTSAGQWYSMSFWSSWRFQRFHLGRGAAARVYVWVFGMVDATQRSSWVYRMITLPGCSFCYIEVKVKARILVRLKIVIILVVTVIRGRITLIYMIKGSLVANFRYTNFWVAGEE